MTDNVHNINVQCISMVVECTYLTISAQDVLILYTKAVDHTMYIHCTYNCSYYVYTLYIHGSYIDILCTCALFIQCLYHRGNFHCDLACNPFMIGLDSAYRQESANQYIHGLAGSVVAKKGCGIWSAFLCHFPFFVSIHHSAAFNTVQPLTDAFKRILEEKSQES